MLRLNAVVSRSQGLPGRQGLPGAVASTGIHAKGYAHPHPVPSLAGFPMLASIFLSDSLPLTICPYLLNYTSRLTATPSHLTPLSSCETSYCSADRAGRAPLFLVPIFTFSCTLECGVLLLLLLLHCLSRSWLRHCGWYDSAATTMRTAVLETLQVCLSCVFRFRVMPSYPHAPSASVWLTYPSPRPSSPSKQAYRETRSRSRGPG